MQVYIRAAECDFSDLNSTDQRGAWIKKLRNQLTAQVNMYKNNIAIKHRLLHQKQEKLYCLSYVVTMLTFIPAKFIRLNLSKFWLAASGWVKTLFQVKLTHKKCIKNPKRSKRSKILFLNLNNFYNKKKPTENDFKFSL